MNLAELSLKNRLLVGFLVVTIIAGGVSAFFKMGKMEDPELIVRIAQVLTVYPGASAYEVELQVTDPLEKAIRTMTGLGSVESKSAADMSIIQVTLDVTLPEKEIQQHWDMLRRKVHDATSGLPPEAQEPRVMDDFGDVYGLFYVLTEDGFSDDEFNDYVEKIKQALQTVEGVGKVMACGEQKPCIYIDIKQDRLAHLGVHFYELIQTLRNQNRMVYPGYFNSGTNRMRLQVTDSYHGIEEVENLLVKGHEDDQLRLRDIASLRYGVIEPARNGMRYDGQVAVGLAVSMAAGHDITTVGEAVEKRLEQLERTGSIPLGVEFHKVFFQSDRVNDAIHVFLRNLLEAIVIVIVVLMLTMGFRSGVILGTNLLVIVLGSFIVLHLFDGALQRVSLGALVLALGMLVDDAVVVIDGILVDRQRGLPRMRYLTGAARRTAIPLLGATLIAILAFFPIVLSPDMAGVYVRDMFIVLAVSLAISWVLSVTLAPIQADLFLRKKKTAKSEKELFSGTFYVALRTTLYFLLSHRLCTLAAVVVLLALSAGGFLFVRQGFFPDFKYEQAYIEYKMPEGVHINKVKADLQRIEQQLLARNDVRHVTSSYGGTPFRYNLVRSLAEPSLSYGELIVDFTSPKAMQQALPALQKELSEAYPQAYVRVKQYNLMYKPFPIEVLFSGPDPAVLKDLSAQAEAIMDSEPSVMLPTNNWEPATPVLTVAYNQPAARQAGVARSDVALSLLAATDGMPVGTYYNGATAEPLILRATDSRDAPFGDLSNIPLFTAIPGMEALQEEAITGLLLNDRDLSAIIDDVLQPPLLSQVSDGITLHWDDPVVRRVEGQRAICAQCCNMFGYTPAQAQQAIKKQVEQIALPEGYEMSWRGEAQAKAESTRYLFAGVPISIILMIVVLIMLFKDVRKPLIIFLCIPLAAIGIVGGLLVSGKEFGFVAIVASLGLIGMMIRNGIVLLEEIARLVGAGVPPVEALLTASASRFRPVVMAAATSIVGMIPLLSDVLFGSLAVVFMGGLTVGTVITLMVVPVLYALFYKIRVGKGGVHRS
ncbi:MAG: efflux RND transporter permease subunit [Prevotellaceae bacterium]|jgi:multidrug efflux pump subunit AcrB|nr:efflux RND transporter permease subunit [Prevotellaceae bacterium]